MPSGDLSLDHDHPHRAVNLSERIGGRMCRIVHFLNIDQNCGELFCQITYKVIKLEKVLIAMYIILIYMYMLLPILNVLAM